MNKKTLFLAGLFAFGLCTWEVQAINLEMSPLYHYYNYKVNNMPNEFDKIDLLGDLLYGVGPNAIEAGASDDAVYIGFNQNFGNVSIKIYNATGNLVYSTIVNTAVQPVIIIPISSMVTGTYIVELSNANGYAEGDFERN